MTRLHRLIAAAGLALGLALPAAAAERTVTLEVENMTCASCPYIVRQALKGVEGVTAATVSLEDRTATVTFDDARTAVDALTRATSEAGYPAAPRDAGS